MKWNEALAYGTAIMLGIIFVLVPILSFIGQGIGIVDVDPKFSAYSDGSYDIRPFMEDLERYNSHVRSSVYFRNSVKDNDGVYDYETKSIVSSPVILLGKLIDPSNSLYIAVGIEKAYTQEEIEALNSYLTRGGHVIVADDFGNANSLAQYYGVTYFGGQLFDERFDKDVNYTLVTSRLGSDVYDLDGVNNNIWTPNNPFNDGVWDDDQDADGKIDEDDNTGSSKNYDDDRDNSKLKKDLWDDDNDGIVDEENEGIDEDPIDDDVVFMGPNGDSNVLWYGHKNVDLERLDGIDNDGDQIVDEDLMTYEVITYKPTGLSSSVNPWVWATGTSKSFIDMDNNRILSIPSGNLKGKNADEISSIGNEIQICVELPVADDGTGAVDVVSGESKETFKEADGSPQKYKVGNRNQDSDKVITELGSIVFISDPSIFMKDLYDLNHISYDVNLPDDPQGNNEDDDGDGLIDEDREILREVGQVSDEDQQDANNLADNTDDYWSQAEVDGFPWLSQSMVGKPKLDYDNRQFLLDLVHHLCPAKEGETNLVLIDESRHLTDKHMLVPIYKTFEVTGFLTSSPYYAYPIIISLGFLLIFSTLMVRDKESWVHNFDISELVPRKGVPVDNKLQTTKLRLAMREKVRLIRGLSPEEFSSLNERTIISSVKDPDLIELLQNQDRIYSPQEVQRLMEKIKKIQNI
ncbi:MAG: hypothetical protein MUC62_10320 [Candidatus Thermoplasmatota archaeon]|jgi:hypothetical protein|nr:hypothetical protein [Candidatus Thermoplasmatota archaeon]